MNRIATLKAVKLVMKCTGKTLPVLRLIHLQGTGGVLHVVGADLDHFLDYKVEDCASEFSCSVEPADFKRLLEYKRLDAHIQLERLDNRLKVTSGAVSIDMACQDMAEDEIPFMGDSGQPLQTAELSPEAMTAIQDAFPYCSKNTSRGTLQGALLYPWGICGTNGKLAYFKELGGMPDWLNSNPASITTFPALEFKDKTTFSMLENGRFELGTNDFCYRGKRYEGNLPNVKQVIPDAKFLPHKINDKFGKLADFIDLVSHASAPNGPDPVHYLILRSENGLLVADLARVGIIDHAASEEEKKEVKLLVDFSEKFDLEYTGNQLRFKINQASYLLKNGFTSISLPNDLGPSIFRKSDSEFVVVMPMRAK